MPFRNRDMLGISEEEYARLLAADKLEEIIEEDQPEEEDLLSDAVEEGTYNREEVIELCRTDLNFLAATALPETFKYFFPKVMLAIWQFMVLNSDLAKKFPQLAIGIPRGHAKTTLVKLFILYCILFTKKKFILVISSTSNLAENIISDVADMLDAPNIKAIFGDWRGGMEKDTQTLKKFGFRNRNIILVAIGAEGSLRGLNIKNSRPDVMIFEDVQTRECADSKQQSEILEKWMVGTAMKAKSPEGCLFAFIGNMYPTPYSILKKMKENASWTKFISGAILADGTALWEELRSLESLLEELDNDMASGHPEIFFSEVLNDTEAGMNTTIDFSQFKNWEWKEQDLPQGKFLVIDPSQGKGLDKDCIGYFEVYDEVIGVREIHEENFSPSNLIRHALVIALKNNVRFIAVEAMAYQFTLLHWFEEICKAIGIQGITFMPIYANANSKNSRIQSGLKTLEAGDMVLHDSLRSRVQKQIADWKPMKRDNIDDMLDVIAYGPKVLADYMYDIATPTSITMIENHATGVVENNSPI